jgi:HSP20 family protein
VELKLFTPLMTLEQEMQSIFDRAFGRGLGEWKLHPSTDVSHTEGTMTVEMELPGMEPDEVDIEVEDDMLVVSGEKHRSREVSEEHCYVSERTFGAFERRIMLPDGFDVEGIEARFNAGVLTIEVPVSEPSQALQRRIPVTRA